MQEKIKPILVFILITVVAFSAYSLIEFAKKTFLNPTRIEIEAN